MGMEAASSSASLSPFEQLRLARDILQTEGHALLRLADRLGTDFCRAVEVLFACRGSVIVSGVGKAGLVGQKIAATLASTGTRSHFFHPGEALHGDLGRVHHDDVVLMLSFSGETEEIVRLLPSLSSVSIVAVTGRPASALGRTAAVTLDLGPLREACPLGLAPSTSTTAMLGRGDAWALVLSRLRRFGPLDFGRFHPGGSLGRRLPMWWRGCRARRRATSTQLGPCPSKPPCEPSRREGSPATRPARHRRARSVRISSGAERTYKAKR